MTSNEEKVTNSKFIFPLINLQRKKMIDGLESENEKMLTIALLTNVLNDFKINGDIVDVKQSKSI